VIVSRYHVWCCLGDTEWHLWRVITLLSPLADGKEFEDHVNCSVIKS